MINVELLRPTSRKFFFVLRPLDGPSCCGRGWWHDGWEYMVLEIHTLNSCLVVVMFHCDNLPSGPRPLG